jgi:acyl-CoA reductase-like NAD-dependent aldehyde dehydrogenase
LVNQEGLDKVEGMLKRAEANGVETLLGGKRADVGKGFFFDSPGCPPAGLSGQGL